MIRIVATLFWHDLAVAFKNKTLFLVLCIPLFVVATLALVDRTGAPPAVLNLALVETDSYAPVLLDSLTAQPDPLALRWVSSQAEAERLVEEREVDGVLVHEGEAGTGLALVVLQQSSPETLDILRRVSARQAAVDGALPSWIAAVRPLQTGSVKRQTLPVWILMMVLLISFIVLPGQVAEEKEKQLLLGWLQTPVRAGDWLAAKLLYGLVLTLASVVAIAVSARESFGAHTAGCLAIVGLGGLCFGGLGICLGLLCRNQASARTLGVLVYLPMLVPAALFDMSPALRSVAPWMPSFQLFEPLRSMMLGESGPWSFPRAWITLLAVGLFAALGSLRLIKVRWLM